MQLLCLLIHPTLRALLLTRLSFNACIFDNPYNVVFQLRHRLLRRKFHFRVFVLVAGALAAYVHDDVFLLLACEPYREDDFSDAFVHLTNRSQQLRHPG